MILADAAAALHGTGAMSELDYVSLTEARPGPEQDRRRAVHRLAMQYVELRDQNGHWDIASYTQHVITQLRAADVQDNGMPFPQVRVSTRCILLALEASAMSAMGLLDSNVACSSCCAAVPCCDLKRLSCIVMSYCPEGAIDALTPHALHGL